MILRPSAITATNHDLICPIAVILQPSKRYCPHEGETTQGNSTLMPDDANNDPTLNATKDRRPIPDPTLLTTQQLMRELASLKELIFTRIGGMDEATKLLQAQADRVPSDTDKAIQHLREWTETRFDAIELRFEARNAEKLYDEKFHSIETQFKERDTRTEQTSKDSKVAVDAALQAAKEAVGEQNKSSALAIAKSEASTAKQIDQLQTLITATSKSSDEKVADLKERLIIVEGRAAGTEGTAKIVEEIKERITRIEGIAGGREANQKQTHDNSSMYIALAALVVAIVVGAVAIMRPATIQPVAVAPMTNPR
jgi:hypothetical protein